MSYTELEFKLEAAILDGWVQGPNGMLTKDFGNIGSMTNKRTVLDKSDLPDYYNDLNLLMPLAFKQDIEIAMCSMDEWYVEIWVSTELNLISQRNTDPIQAIRDCLFKLAQERKG